MPITITEVITGDQEVTVKADITSFGTDTTFKIQQNDGTAWTDATITPAEPLADVFATGVKATGLTNDTEYEFKVLSASGTESTNTLKATPTAAASEDTTAPADTTEPKKTAGMFAVQVDFHYNRRYEVDITAMAKVTAELQAVPPPSIFMDILRENLLTSSGQGG